MRLAFKDCKVIMLSKYPGEDGTTQVLKVRALLTRTLAEQLKCRDLCFAENEMPRRFDTLKLAEKIQDCEIVFDDGTWLANQVSHFSIGRPKEASETDASLEIRCNLHFDGHVPLSEWVDEKNKSEFQMSLKPPKDWNAQGELFADGADDPDGEEDSDDDVTSTHCVDCENEVPFAAGSDTLHASGQHCATAKREQEQQDDSTANGTLASAREAAGGTHQRGRKVRRLRLDVDETSGEPVGIQ